MASVNKCILVGNCGRDPEIRYTQSGMAVCSTSIATSRKSKSGEEETQWHRVTFFDKLAEIAGEYLKKGKPVYVEGELKYGKYTDKDGVERNTTDIVVSQMQLLGGREDGGGDRQERQAPRAAAPQRQAPARQAAKPSTGFDDMDDPIPF